jgi:alpha-beta hydrolase superfamily lysophospholipase
MMSEIAPFRTTDGLTLHTESWPARGTPRGVVVLVHGYGEHLGRYRHVAEYLSARDYAVYALDHRGHGRSDGLRAHVDRFDEFIDDLHGFVLSVRAQQPGKPLFMYGHSMGALISLAYCLQHQDQLAGLVISGAPLNADANVSPVLVALGSVLTQIIPKMPFLSFGEDNSILSRDPAVVQAFDTDPLNWKDNMRIRLGTEINRTAGRVRAGLPALKLPVLIMHGDADKMVNPSGSQLAYAQIGSADKTLKLYPGLRHEVHNEPEKLEVLHDVTEWLDAHAER